MRIERQTFDFHVNRKRGRAVTSDDPPFEVWLGRRSAVAYADDANTIEVGADFPGGQVVIVAASLRRKITNVPEGLTAEEYETSVLARIAAAVAWEGEELVVR